MRDQARVVIIGAGIVGCSAAYHLAQLGWSDIVVLDQGPLFATGGSTSHAPGLMFQLNASRTVTHFARYSVELYGGLRLDGAPVFAPVGSLEVATTPERWEELKRKQGHALSWGLEAELISADAAGRLIPIMRTDHLYGALHIPSDGAAKGAGVAEALARAAQERGAAFYGHTPVMSIAVADGRVQAVETARGRIHAEHVLVCAGIWGPRIGRMAGVAIPLTPVQHQYTRTVPLPALAGETRDIAHPILRHQDRSMYFRQHGDCYGIGSYRHEPLLVDPDDIRPHTGQNREPRTENRETGTENRATEDALMPFTPEHFAEAHAHAIELFPAMRDAALASAFNGMFSFTPDGQSLLGESPDVRGLWVAEAVWVTHAGGVGRAIAEWMVAGTPSLDLREVDLNRFHSHALGRDYIRARGAQQYREVYDIIHPLQPIEHPRGLRLSPFHRRQEELSAVFFESAGWERPQWFAANGTEKLSEKGEFEGVAPQESPSHHRSSVTLRPFQTASEDRGSKIEDSGAGATGQPSSILHPPSSRQGWAARFWSPTIGIEHQATRTGVALFDLTPLTKLEVSGPGALRFLEYMAANRIDRPAGSVIYTALLNERGGIECDLTVTRLDDARFLLVTGGASGMRDLAWLRLHAPADGSVTIRDVTSSMCCAGLWGPRAHELARRACDDALSDAVFPPFTARRITIGHVPALALRISYAGEPGWEIYAPTEYSLVLWDTLWVAGQPFGLVAAGVGALESLRLERGYRLWGADIDGEHTPYEAGLGFAVKLDKGDFIGRAALLSAKEQLPTRALCRITLDDPHVIVMGKEPILDGERVLGYVTSAGYGYMLRQSIVYGYLPPEYAAEGRRVQVQFFGQRYGAQVVREPLHDLEASVKHEKGGV